MEIFTEKYCAVSSRPMIGVSTSRTGGAARCVLPDVVQREAPGIPSILFKLNLRLTQPLEFA